MQQWYFAVPGQQPRGPVRIEELKRLAAQGQVRPQDLAWRVGMASWLPAAQVPELAGSVRTGPAIAQPGTAASTAAPPPAKSTPLNTPSASPAPPPAPKTRGSGFLGTLHSLPKPILFGLYGALGAILGALILGEIINLLFPAARPMILNLPREPVPMFSGTQSTFPIQLVRIAHKGEVELELVDPPPGLNPLSLTIPAEGSPDAPDDGKMELTFQATADLKPGSYPITVRARGGNRNEEAVVQLEVKPALGLAVPREIHLYHNDANKGTIKVMRGGFSGPIHLELVPPLPGKDDGGRKLVAAEPLEIPEGATEGEMVFKTDIDTGERTFPLKIIARTRDKVGDTVLEVARPILIKVGPCQPALALAASGKVAVFQGGKCKFTVKVARTGFDGPVRLTYEGLPRDVLFPECVLPAGASEIEIEGEARSSAPVGESNVQVHGTALESALKAAVQVSVEVKRFDPPRLDVVFVLDTTGSMGRAIQGVKNGIGLFVKDLTDQGLDARVGLAAFRDLAVDPPPWNMYYLKFGASYFTRDPHAFKTAMAPLFPDGGGDYPESSHDAMFNAAEKFDYRKDAQKIIILITDDAPKLLAHVPLDRFTRFPDHVPITRDQVQKALRDKGIDQVHLVLPEMYRGHYEPLWESAKGNFFDLARVGTGEAFARELLPELSRKIASLVVAEGPSAPRGSVPPAPTLPPGAVLAPGAAGNVELEGAKGSPTIGTIMGSSAVDREQWLVVVLLTGLWTAVMAAGIALLLIIGQRLYLTRSLPTFGDILRVVAAGLTVGLLGGGLAAALFLLSSGTALMDFLTRVPAWTIMGGLLGMGIGLFVPNLGALKGLLGGCIGGLIGALGFVAISATAGAVAGRLIGALLVGFFIGLMIALAEMAFRRYWLEVAFGAREIRTVTLGAVPVTVGGDERQAAVFVPGEAPRALGFRVEGERILCQDFTSGRTYEVTPGQQQMVGKVRLTVRGAGAAAPAGAPASGLTLRLASGKTLQLANGLPLTAQDLPGLEPSGTEGMVALISPRPANPKVLLLRNRSKQTWRVTDAQGTRAVGPGLGIDLTSAFQIDFGPVKGVFTPTGTPAG